MRFCGFTTPSKKEAIILNVPRKAKGVNEKSSNQKLRHWSTRRNFTPGSRRVVQCRAGRVALCVLDAHSAWLGKYEKRGKELVGERVRKP